MHLVLDVAVRSVSLRPCRARCESSIRERFTIRLRQGYGGTGVMDRGDRREDIFEDRLLAYPRSSLV